MYRVSMFPILVHTLILCIHAVKNPFPPLHHRLWLLSLMSCQLPSPYRDHYHLSYCQPTSCSAIDQDGKSKLSRANTDSLDEGLTTCLFISLISSHELENFFMANFYFYFLFVWKVVDPLWGSCTKY